MTIELIPRRIGIRDRAREDALKKAMGHIVPHELKGMVPAIDSELEELRSGKMSDDLRQFVTIAEAQLNQIETALNDSFRDTSARGFEETIRFAQSKVSPRFANLERLAQRTRDLFAESSREYQHIDLVRYHSNRGVFYVEGITRLIKNLSSFHRPGASSARIPREPVNLRELVHRVERRLRKSSRDETLFTVRASQLLPTILGDEALIYMVMRNLISNAIKYAFPGRLPFIDVRLYDQPTDDLAETSHEVIAAYEAYLEDQLSGRTLQEVREILAQREDSIRIAVIDNGKGIPRSVRGKIFRPFHRGALERVTGEGDHGMLLERGLGVGLTAVDWAVRLHGGSVSVGSVPDVGSVFVLAFPNASLYFNRYVVGE